MPLIILCGLPSSGKSTRAQELSDFFKEKNKKVIVISENVGVPKANYQKNEYFDDSQKEKIVRADLKSETIRSLNKENVVILDAGNYIKGYRYEIYCASKSARVTQCTIYCAITKTQAWEFNEKREMAVEDLTKEDLNNSNFGYTREMFDALCLRFEEPHGNNRWDSPLFTTFPDNKIDLNLIYSSLFEAKPPPPNLSTQNAPLSATNYLFELDKITQEIISHVISARKIGILGPVPVPQTDLKINTPSDMNPSQLNRMRQQFLKYSKMHTGSSNLEKIPQLFVQFLNSQV